MIDMSLYMWIKAAHVAAIVVFVGGTLAAGVACAVLPSLGDRAADAAAGFRRWDQRLTVPALLATWGFGLVIASWGGWFTATWLEVKLPIVLLLSALHGIQSGRLGRIAAGGTVGPWKAVPLIIMSVIIVAALAVVKPG